MECQEIISKHFFFCPSSLREFAISFVIDFFYRGVSRLRVQKCTDFGFFEYCVAIYAIWTTGNVVALHGWWCPSSHWIHHTLGAILIGHTWCGEEKPDLIALPGRGVGKRNANMCIRQSIKYKKYVNCQVRIKHQNGPNKCLQTKIFCWGKPFFICH